MFKIPQIEKSIYYIDSLMEQMQEFALKEREAIAQRWSRTISTHRKEETEVKLNKRKDLELQKVRFLSEKVNQQLRKLVKRFPNYKKIDQIYIDLINTSTSPVKKQEDALKRLMWITNTVDEFAQNTEAKLKRAKTHDTIGFIMKKFLGRVNSLYKKNKDFFAVLEDARKFMNKLPKFEELFTVSIGGFPNVGKSTLMKEMTGSNVEIQNYPFTTKGLMFGYLVYNEKKYIQLIDTPGLLGRDKNNAIEERAELVLRNYCDSIVYVLDFTESCGFGIESQLKLLKKTMSAEKPMVVYLSKTDIYDERSEEVLEEFASKIKKFKQFKDPQELKKYLIDESLKRKKKFDPSKLKVIK